MISIVDLNTNDKEKVKAYMVKGERGYSAYEIAVQNGYEGTEEEWTESFINADNYYNKSEIKGLVIDNLTSTVTDQPLSAKQGKVLKDTVDTKINTSDIVDNVTSTDTNKPLSAKQGKVLKDAVDTKVNTSDIVDNVTSTDTDKPLSAKQGKVLKDAVDTKKTASDFAVVTGTSDTTSFYKHVNYPTGFTKDNCVALSLEIKVSSSSYYTMSQVISDGTTKFDIAVQLASDDIVITDTYSRTKNDAFDFKIVLMKIS